MSMSTLSSFSFVLWLYLEKMLERSPSLNEFHYALEDGDASEAPRRIHRIETLTSGGLYRNDVVLTRNRQKFRDKPGIGFRCLDTRCRVYGVRRRRSSCKKNPFRRVLFVGVCVSSIRREKFLSKRCKGKGALDAHTPGG